MLEETSNHTEMLCREGGGGEEWGGAGATAMGGGGWSVELEGGGLGLDGRVGCGVGSVGARRPGSAVWAGSAGGMGSASLGGSCAVDRAGGAFLDGGCAAIRDASCGGWGFRGEVESWGAWIWHWWWELV